MLRPVSNSMCLYLCVFVQNVRMWYLVCVRGRPQRRSMLTRRAAGPPDVPAPTRLVASGPLLLPLPCTRMHTHTQAHIHVFVCVCAQHKGFLSRAIHSTQTATQTAKLLYSVATLDLHTMRISFKEHGGEHVNPPGLRDKLPFLFTRPHFRFIPTEPCCCCSKYV